MDKYDPQTIEAKWQKVWADESSFHVPNPSAAELAAHRERTYVVDMLPYPSRSEERRVGKECRL